MPRKVIRRLIRVKNGILSRDLDLISQGHKVMICIVKGSVMGSPRVKNNILSCDVDLISQGHAIGLLSDDMHRKGVIFASCIALWQCCSSFSMALK